VLTKVPYRTILPATTCDLTQEPEIIPLHNTSHRIPSPTNLPVTLHPQGASSVWRVCAHFALSRFHREPELWEEHYPIMSSIVRLISPYPSVSCRMAFCPTVACLCLMAHWLRTCARYLWSFATFLETILTSVSSVVVPCALLRYSRPHPLDCN
jgi:hypothetical protein